MNGTGDGQRAFGKSENADINTPILDKDGKVITDAQEAFSMANRINPKEKHSYDLSKRITTTESEDKNAIAEASAAA